MIGIIIQARNGSSRFLNKMTIPFYNDQGILEIIINRLKEAELNVPIILATTTSSKDNEIVNIGQKYDISVFRGSEENVLERFIQVSELYKINKIIRICADNPFLDLNAIKIQIKEFENSNVDYWCYSLSDQTPTIKTHYGYWAEGVTLDTLNKVASLTQSKLFLEHVTNYIYSTENNFIIHRELIPTNLEKGAKIRLTVDTEKDFVITKEIYHNALNEGIEFTANALSDYVRSNLKWIKSMNQEIIKNEK